MLHVKYITLCLTRTHDEHLKDQWRIRDHIDRMDQRKMKTEVVDQRQSWGISFVCEVSSEEDIWKPCLCQNMIFFMNNNDNFNEMIDECDE